MSRAASPTATAMTVTKTLMRLAKVVRAQIVKRPSAVIKSPYVADILLSSNDGVEQASEALAHCPSLGCCGLSDKGAYVWMTPIPLKKNMEKHEKCAYRVVLTEFRDELRDNQTIVGLYPKHAEDLVEEAIKANFLTSLQNIKSYKRESTLVIDGVEEDSRFDYVGIDADDNEFVLEVKNVPLADYEDIADRDKKTFKVEYGLERGFYNKVGYFPDGYRKKSAEAISPRALKHIRSLAHIKRNDASNSKRCVICFVIQRRDVDRFTPSVIDPEYRRAFYEARACGVEVIAMQVEWKIEPNIDGSSSATAYLITDNLPVVEEHQIFTPPAPVVIKSSASKRKSRTVTNAEIDMEEVQVNITSELVENTINKKKRTSKKAVPDTTKDT
jgi:DNA-binding sugar fermentation-stimulating protein